MNDGEDLDSTPVPPKKTKHVPFCSGPTLQQQSVQKQVTESPVVTTLSTVKSKIIKPYKMASDEEERETEKFIRPIRCLYSDYVMTIDKFNQLNDWGKNQNYPVNAVTQGVEFGNDRSIKFIFQRQSVIATN